MKDLTLSVVAVLLLALALGLGFHWLYPQVELNDELAGLFVFVAVALKLLAGWLWSLRRRSAPAEPAAGSARKNP